MKSLFCRTALSIAVLSITAPVFAADPEVTPYRPGVGSPAVLSATGYAELELGYDLARGGGVRADAFGALLKYGLSDNFGLLVGLPYLRIDAGGASERGLSDGTLGLKFVTKGGEGLAYGAQLSMSLPTGKDAFRSDNPSVNLTGLLGVDFSGFHADFNLGLTQVGDVDFGVSKSRTNYSLGVSRALDGGFGVGVEASGTRQSGAGNVTTILGALTYTVNRNFAVDTSVSRSRSGGTNVNGFGVGMTYLFGK